MTKSTTFIQSILFIIFSLLLSSQNAFSQTTKQPWKGYSVLGNGNMCLVYSDDQRITKRTKCKGIQHFYFGNYTHDYIASSSFEISGVQYSSSSKIGMKNFCTTETSTNYSNGLVEKVDCFVLPQNAAVLSLHLENKKILPGNKFNLILRKTIVTRQITTLISLNVENNIAIAEWSNGFYLAVLSNKNPSNVEVSDSSINITNGDEIIIAAGNSIEEIKSTLEHLHHQKDFQKTAHEYWNKWLSLGGLPKFNSTFKEAKRYLQYFKGSLYAVKSACINGQIPADITGEFVTENMPQLYPRDAMMCARVFMMTGHYKEAKSIISFWGNNNIPKKSIGEFFARYDAYGKAIDAGSGARYNEPEWDANGYFIQLVNDYYKAKKVWLVNKKFIYELADFLVNHLDKSGLLYEGGIVEWTGYLPSTNMTCAAALKTASDIASKFNDASFSKKYLEASKTISNSLYKLFDTKRNALCALRFHGVKAEGNYSISTASNDTLFLWDTSLNFGILWGYPNNLLVTQTNEFIEDSTSKQNGGIQYFEALDNAWLSNYGGDVFFFTTAAASQYQSLYGKLSLAKQHIDWMIKNSNTYNLMPERIYLNESDCSEASPLSWCNAEFAASIYVFSKKMIH